MGKPWLLDLFCGAGGATKGYQDAGFFVIGVDIDAQPNYVGDMFIQADVREFMDRLLAGGTWEYVGLHLFVAIHASPPCQAYSDLQKRTKKQYPRLIEPTRAALITAGKPYVIENVEGAPLIDPIVLCGTMFPELRVLRHRLFESNVELTPPAHPPRPHPLVFTHDKRKGHYGKLNQDESYVQVTGGGNCTIANAREAMGINWMTKGEINESIPPAYTKYIGDRLMRHI